MKMTKELLKERKEKAAKSNTESKFKLMELAEKGLNRSFVNPINPVTSKDSWLGSRALHSRSSKDVYASQEAYAYNRIGRKRGKN